MSMSLALIVVAAVIVAWAIFTYNGFVRLQLRHDGILFFFARRWFFAEVQR